MARNQIRKVFGKNRTEVIGEKEVRKALKSLGAKVRREITVPAMEKAMRPMLARAKTEVAQDTGHTVAALVETVKGQQRGRVIVDVQIKGIPYARWVEYGTKLRPPDRAMMRTFDAEKQRTIDTALAEIRAGIERHSTG